LIVHQSMQRAFQDRAFGGGPDASAIERHKTSAVGACLVACVAAGGVASAAPAVPVTEAAYRAEVERWRAERDERLRAPDGWLSLVALSWLKPGANRFGSAGDNEVILPEPAPAHAGTLVVE